MNKTTEKGCCAEFKGLSARVKRNLWMSNIETKRQLIDLLEDDHGCAIVSRGFGKRSLEELRDFVGFDIYADGVGNFRFKDNSSAWECIVLKRGKPREMEKRYNRSDSPRIPVFARRFGELVKAHGGISAVAKITGISSPTINFWLKGQRTPDACNLITIAKSFNVSCDYLLGLDDEKLKAEICFVKGKIGKVQQEINKIFNDFLEKHNE